MIRIGDSESPRHALSNGIALIRLYDKVNLPAPIPNSKHLAPSSFTPMGSNHPSSLPRTGSGSRVIVIITLDSEAPGDRYRELCNLFVNLLNSDPVPLLMQHLHLGNSGDSL